MGEETPGPDEEDGAEESADPNALQDQKTRTHRRLTLIAAGHDDQILAEELPDGSRETILKKMDVKELAIYQKLFAVFGEDPLQRATPCFYGESTSVSSNGSSELGHYLKLSNLLAGFSSPAVMDCKLGVRSYQESECSSKKRRPDLFKKLQELSRLTPLVIQEDDLGAEACTKERWMSTRDAVSSTQSLGFRIDGIAGPGDRRRGWKDFCGISSAEKVVRELHAFLPSEERANLGRIIVHELEEIRTRCEQSPFFQSHEFVGTSLLFIVEGALGIPPRASVTIIDFAKTEALPPGVAINHRSPWVLGNHEDGVLFGIDNCIECWRTVVAEIEQDGDVVGSSGRHAEEAGDSP